MPTNECLISDNGSLPQCTAYQSKLANPQLKSRLISYIMDKFRNFALSETSQRRLHIIMLAFEGVDCPISISCGSEVHVPMFKIPMVKLITICGIML